MNDDRIAAINKAWRKKSGENREKSSRVLIIAIMFQNQCTYSCEFDLDDCDARVALKIICDKRGLDQDFVEEILIVKDNKIIHQYTKEHWIKTQK